MAELSSGVLITLIIAGAIIILAGMILGTAAIVSRHVNKDRETKRKPDVTTRPQHGRKETD